MTQLTGQRDAVVAARPATLLSDLMQLTKLRVTVMVETINWLVSAASQNRRGRGCG